MILFHGTNIDFETIDLNKCNPYKDFGRGFYLTDIYDQALSMAQKRVSLFGGTAIVQQYEFKEEEQMTVSHIFWDDTRRVLWN